MTGASGFPLPHKCDMKFILGPLHTAPEHHRNIKKMRHSASLGRDNQLEGKNFGLLKGAGNGTLGYF